MMSLSGSPFIVFFGAGEKKIENEREKEKRKCRKADICAPTKAQLHQQMGRLKFIFLKISREDW